MKVTVIYDVDGTSTMRIKAPHISAQVFAGGRAIVKMSNKKGKVTKIFIFSKVYLIEHIK